MEMVDVNRLVAHPQNSYFFDDIEGDNWQEFLKSIQTSGVIEPIVISQEYMIVSGHQRVRACKELGINEIPSRIRIYDSEDIILKELIETNLRQRGIGNPNPIKFARCIVFLERFHGIQNGGDKRAEADNPLLKSQSELAEDIGISKDQLKGYKKLLTLIPELQDLIESGELSPTVGYKVWSKLPQEEQSRLVTELGKDKIAEMTQKQTQQYLAQIKRLENDMSIAEETIDELREQVPEGDVDATQIKDEYELKVRQEYERAERYRKELDALRNNKAKPQLLNVLDGDENLKQEIAAIYTVVDTLSKNYNSPFLNLERAVFGLVF